MATLNLVSPWVMYYREIEALFKRDPDVRVIYDALENEVKLYVQGAEKASALTELLPVERSYGNVTLKITVVPANGLTNSEVDTFIAAFDGNEAVEFIYSVDLFATKLYYIVFKEEVVHIYTDDLGEFGGYSSTLYEFIADSVFKEHDGIFFSTAISDANGRILGKDSNADGLVVPLGEWP